MGPTLTWAARSPPQQSEWSCLSVSLFVSELRALGLNCTCSQGPSGGPTFTFAIWGPGTKGRPLNFFRGTSNGAPTPCYSRPAQLLDLRSWVFRKLPLMPLPRRMQGRGRRGCSVSSRLYLACQLWDLCFGLFPTFLPGLYCFLFCSLRACACVSELLLPGQASK